MHVQVVSEIPNWEYSFNHIYFTNTEHLEGNKMYAKLSGDKVGKKKKTLFLTEDIKKGSKLFYNMRLVSLK